MDGVFHTTYIFEIIVFALIAGLVVSIAVHVWSWLVCSLQLVDWQYYVDISHLAYTRLHCEVCYVLIH